MLPSCGDTEMKGSRSEMPRDAQSHDSMIGSFIHQIKDRILGYGRNTILIILSDKHCR